MALVVGVLVVVAVSDGYRPASDAYDFDRHALSIAHGDAQRAARRRGGRADGVLARRLFAEDAVGLLAAGIAAVWPPFLMSRRAC